MCRTPQHIRTTPVHPKGALPMTTTSTKSALFSVAVPSLLTASAIGVFAVMPRQPGLGILSLWRIRGIPSIYRFCVRISSPGKVTGDILFRLAAALCSYPKFDIYGWEKYFFCFFWGENGIFAIEVDVVKTLCLEIDIYMYLFISMSLRHIAKMSWSE